MSESADGDDEEFGQNQAMADKKSGPGQTRHTCTDIAWVPIFLIALSGVGYVMHFAATKGDIRRVYSGSDYLGRVCGLDENVTEYPYVFWCRAAPKRGDHGPPICVEACPTSNKTRHLCKDPDLAWLTEVPDYRTRPLVNYCMPKNRTKAKQALQRLVGTPFGGNKKIFMSLRNSLPLLAVSTIAAIAFAYAYLVVIIKGNAEFLVMVCMAFIVAAPMIVGCVFVWMANHGGSGAFVGRMAYYKEYVSGWCLILLALVLCRLLKRHMADISRTTDMIDWSCECLSAESGLLGPPIMAALVKAAVLIVTAYVCMLLVSCGVQKSPRGGIHRQFELTLELKCLLAYCIFTMMWLFEFANSMSQYVLAWSTEQWYFTPYDNESPDRKPDIPFLICRGILNAFKYHVGTLALGSLLVMLFWPVQAFLQVCLILPFERCRRMLHKNVYIEVAMNSKRYSTAAEDFRATVTSGQHCMDGIQLIFQFGGVLAVTVVGCTLTLVAMMATGRCGKSQVYDAEPVVFCAGAISLFIGWCFMNVFDTVGDTMLYCFEKEKALLGDQMDGRSVVGWCLFGGEDGGGLLGWAFGGGDGGTTVGEEGATDFRAEGDDDGQFEKRVYYAPPALRDLLPSGGQHVVRVQRAREARVDVDP